MTKLILEKSVSSEVIDASSADTKKLKNTLAKAFINDPMINWTVKHDDKYFERVELMFETFINHFGLKQGYVHTNQDNTACAIWLPPKGYREFSFISFSLISAWIRTVGFKRMLKVMKGTELLDKYHPKFDCFYLAFLGVLPEEQGKGLGKMLMEPVLNTCDLQNIPAFLETSNEDNISFYEKHGFKIQSEIFEPMVLPKTWTMLRKPEF